VYGCRVVVANINQGVASGGLCRTGITIAKQPVNADGIRWINGGILIGNRG